ncbi:MAG: hypothetical protein ABEJ25_03410 [Candidatus Bipolaricaulia bacterium]
MKNSKHFNLADLGRISGTVTSSFVIGTMGTLMTGGAPSLQ